MDRQRRAESSGGDKADTENRNDRGPQTSFVENYLSATEGISSPKIFRKWAAISALAGVLERKVWTWTQNGPTYPAMYIVLVGPPAVGKSEVVWRINDLWASVEDIHIAPSSVTKASLIDTLAEANRRVILKPEHIKKEPVITFNSLQICISEMGVLLPSYDTDFMHTLTDIWDAKNYSEKRRTRNIEIDIPRPQINLLAGCTPDYLRETLPEGAWSQGFTSRCMFIYSGEQNKVSLFSNVTVDEKQLEELKTDLNRVFNLYGEFHFSPAAASLIDEFHMTGESSAPSHPKLRYYKNRRTRQLLKLCMIAAASYKDELIIEEEDFGIALDWMLEAEDFMPDIFKAMQNSGAGNVMREAWHFLFEIYTREGQEPVAKARFLNYLQDKVPVHSIMQTVEMMKESGMISEKLTPKGPALTPKRTEY